MPVGAACCRDQHPWSDVADRAMVRPAVTAGRRGEDSLLHGVERADGHRVQEIVEGEGVADGDGYDVDPVGDGVVEGCQDVLLGAAERPADLVNGEPGRRHAAPGRATGEAVEAGAPHALAGDGGGRVSPVAIEISRRLFLRRVVQAVVVSRPNDFAGACNTNSSQHASYKPYSKTLILKERTRDPYLLHLRFMQSPFHLRGGGPSP